MKNIILIGFMGSGKSTVAKRLAEEFSLPLVEMDLRIEEKAEMSIPDIFSKFGEEKFRELESLVLLESLENHGVIATGGGVLTKKENQEMLSNESYVFYLKGTLETLLRNIKNDPINIRPLANEKDEKALDSLLKSRLEAYEDVADVIISIDNYSVEEIVSFIKAEIKEMN